MTTEAKSFAGLSTKELFELLRLRTAIFVVEQECAYQEVDDHDPKATHILGRANGMLVACARLLPPETAYAQASIGRVAVSKEHRGHGYGREIFSAALATAKKLYPGQELKVQAQCYLEDFYKSFGFKTVSAPYPDFDIMHVDMKKAPE